MNRSTFISPRHGQAHGLALDRTTVVPDGLPPPGFSSVMIPVPNGALYLNSIDGPAATTTVPSPRPPPPAPATQSGIYPTAKNGMQSIVSPESAYTLLIVDDNYVNRRIYSKFCEKGGQPYVLAENGQQAVELYKRDPKRLRCILMDLSMPVLDGFHATRQIREFEDETWEAFISSSNQTGTIPIEPAPRAVIIAVAAALSLPGMQQRIVNDGFDLGICSVMGPRVLSDLLFTGPGSNVASVYGAVEDQALLDAGYLQWPLRTDQIRDSEGSRASEVSDLWRVRADD